jgi:hypothetical protein
MEIHFVTVPMPRACEVTLSTREPGALLDEYSNVIAHVEPGWEQRIIGALNLLAQLDAQHGFEDGLLDPVDWDSFTAFDLLAVARGETTLHKCVWEGSPTDARIQKQDEEEASPRPRGEE